MSQTGEQLQASDHGREQTDVLNVSIDMSEIEIVAQIFREIRQSTEN